jgi:hypothetical protein
MPYNQGQMQYGQQTPYNNQYGGYNQQMGTMDAFGNIKYTRSQIIQGLRDYVINMSGVIINKEERIEDTPQLLRHACAEAKVSYLSINYFMIPEMCMQVPFYFCTACGKLFYPRDFM